MTGTSAFPRDLAGANTLEIGGDGPAWLMFRDRMVALVRALPTDLSPSTPLWTLQGFGSFDRVALHRAIAVIAPGAPQELIGELQTFGDLHQLALRQADPDRVSMRIKPSREDVSTERIRLRPLEESDLEPLYLAAIDPRSSYRWRFRGGTPSRQGFHDSLHTGVLAQFVVADRISMAVHGLVTAYNANPENGYAYCGFYRAHESGVGAGEMTEGLCLFLDYLFRSWPFRKIYFEVPEYNLDFLTNYSASIVKEEGRLEGHVFHAGRYIDVLIVAAYREPFMELAEAWWSVLDPIHRNNEGADHAP